MKLFHRQRWCDQPVENKSSMEQNQISLSLTLWLSCAPHFLINLSRRSKAAEQPMKVQSIFFCFNECCESGGSSVQWLRLRPLSQRCQEMVNGDGWAATSGVLFDHWCGRGRTSDKESKYEAQRWVRMSESDIFLSLSRDSQRPLFAKSNTPFLFHQIEVYLGDTTNLHLAPSHQHMPLLNPNTALL